MANLWTRNCDHETDHPVEGEIKGEIPGWIDGVLISNGPGKTQIGDTTFNHVFDGMAMMHKFTIKNGAATYMSKFLKSDSYVKNMAANRIVCSEFGTVRFPDPCQTIWKRNMVKFLPHFNTEMTDNCLVSVCYFGDKLYALTEGQFVREIDPKTLDTLGDKLDLSQHVAVNHATAHPHTSPDGTVFNIGNSYMGKAGPCYNIIEFPPSKVDSGGREISMFDRAKIVAKIPSRWKMHPSYYHSFAITPRYWIFVEQPLCISVPKMMASKGFGQAFASCLKYFPNEKARFHVISRETGEEVQHQYFSSAFFCFHHINAYEDREHLVVDLCVSHDASAMNDMYHARMEKMVNNGEKSALTYPQRFVLPLQPEETEGNLISIHGTRCKAEKQNDGSILCTPEDLSSEAMELPRINYNLNGKPYMHFYAGGITGVRCMHKLFRVNTKNKETVSYEEDGYEFSEPIFIQKPGETDEMAGVVVAGVLSLHDDTEAGLVIMEPTSWTVLARIRFRARGVVTKCFHGQFAGAESVHIF